MKKGAKQEGESLTVYDTVKPALLLSVLKHQDAYIKVYSPHETMYTDQTERFPVMIRQGNQYIMVMCEIDRNYIDKETMKDRSSGSLCRAF